MDRMNSVPRLSRDVERGHAAIVARIGARAALQQQAHRIDLPLAGGPHQGREPVLVRRVDIDTGSDQRIEHAGVACAAA